MDFHKRMQAAMLIVIVVCMMCVSTVLAREEKLAKEEGTRTNLYAACETEMDVDL